MTDTSAARRASLAPAGQAQRRSAGHTTAFQVGDLTGTLISALGNAPTAVTVDLRVGKHGSTLAGLTEALAAAASLAWQHGTPLVEITDAWQQTRFVPNGPTDDPDIPDTTSLADYVARRLLLDHPRADPSTAGTAFHDGQATR